MTQKWIQKARNACNRTTPEAIVEIVARKLFTADNCKERIEKEGHVVRDMSGKVVPHPAISILETTEKSLLDILKIYGAKQK
ncbi:hypothetical protein [Nitratifractor salsuginis]|uniref:Uncharacterized protein n=1 Tax=Nitratifractor salsuginis (strain DSM 16511 / JCM 12458 / E9I37-1) TaxID=749222 RepID=E6X1S5_NITSE|nr:hypothetical protein [Nitratifractor salsuginis]ADV47066.1 hypothetical protein Nitsa_1821 [Nitratifractor salsuginis DSM 16511]